MTIPHHPPRHHPSGAWLTGFAAGTLDQGEHIAVATHLAACARCREAARLMEHVGGAVLASLSPTPMADGALARIEARLHTPGVEKPRPAPPGPAPSGPAPLASVPGLPAFVRQYAAAPWKWIAPGVRSRPIVLPFASETRVFLLRSAPGTRMLEHTHDGTEMTCVLTGGFSHGAHHYGPGDFDLGEEGVDHRIAVAPGEDCLCLIAMRGKLRLKGVLGRMLEPLIRL